MVINAKANDADFVDIAVVCCLQAPEPEPHEAKVAQLDKEFVAGYPLKISLPGKAGQLSTADAGSMPTELFNALWQVRHVTIPAVSSIRNKNKKPTAFFQLAGKTYLTAGNA